ncbi:hypothetical protein [Haladaptatus sp. NG-WS-4]
MDGGGRDPYLLRSLMDAKANKQKKFKKAYPFHQSAKIDLKCSEPSKKVKIPKTIGTKLLTAKSATGSQTFSFKSNTASYSLSASVERAVDSSPVKAALDDFRDSVSAANSDAYVKTSPSTVRSKVWKKISPQKVLDRVTQITEKPTVIDQDHENWCGQAAIAFALAWRYPRRFVEICRSLLEEGAFLGHNYEYHAPDDLLKRGSKPEMEAADYISIGTLYTGRRVHLGIVDRRLGNDIAMYKNMIDLLGYSNTQYYSYKHEVKGFEAIKFHGSDTYFKNNKVDDKIEFLKKVQQGASKSGVGILISGSTRADMFGPSLAHAETYIEGEPYNQGDTRINFKTQSYGKVWHVKNTVDNYRKVPIWCAIVGWPKQ